MKNVKRQLAWFLSMLMVITLILSTGITASSAKKTVRLRKIVLNHSTFKLPKGTKLKLKASFKPKNTTQKKLKWKSSKKKVAKVSKKGVVKAIRTGNAKITVTVRGTKKKAVCKIQVIHNNGEDYNQAFNNEPVQTNAPVPTIPSEGGIQPPATTDTPVSSPEPTMNPTDEPTVNPTDEPTSNPTEKPTEKPTSAPTKKPTEKPTSAPTKKPTEKPTSAPTKKPTEKPTSAPTMKPTEKPTSAPTMKPTEKPTSAPTMKPTEKPTSAPTMKPTEKPTSAPTIKPTEKPTSAPTIKPTEKPTSAPTMKPTEKPTSAPTMKPTDKPTSAPTTKPTEKPTSAPTSTPPKYERPSETALPVNTVDFTADGAVHNESANGASIVNNPDGSITVTFTNQYAALNFYLPDNAQIYYSNYKSVVLKYTSTGGNLGHALYDTEMAGSSNQNAGKHPDWGQKIVESDTENTLIFKVTNDCVGGCIRGFQIFNPNQMTEGSSITITIKSLIFCDKENPTDEDLNPQHTATPVPTATPTPAKTPVPTPTTAPGQYDVRAPYSEGENLTWDCITFGSYYQSLYTPKQPPKNPANDTQYTDSDNTKMIYHGGKYYKMEPIQWRILSLDGSNALLIADMNLDSRRFNNENCHSITWEDSSIRQWLNEDFYSTAFTDNERSSIIQTESDNISLLSAEDSVNKDYGFSIHTDGKSITRQAKNTDYAKGMGAWTNDSGEYSGNGWWWLRSAGSMPYDVCYIASEGYADLTGYIAVNAGGGIRPVMHIDLNNEMWTKAESVTVEAASHLMPTPAPTENPVKQVALSGTHFDPSFIGSYDIDADTISINDTRTGQGDSTFMYIPLPITVLPGQKLRVTVSGPKWGTNDFRIWTTPQGGEGDGTSFVVDPNIYLKPVVHSDGSFTGTVEVEAKGKDCTRITLKAGWGAKIQNLIISDIKVSIVQPDNAT